MKKAFLLISFIILLSCKDSEKPSVSFYYWKTIFQLSKNEKNVVRDAHVDKLYVRYFDVKNIQNKPFPVAPIHFRERPASSQIIPVVFIKNEVFLSKAINVSDLSLKIIGLIRQINQANQLTNSEIQIDCDWSLESRDTFISFLKVLKANYHKTISTTIRLHQVKYFTQTKVPPVDYGVLMFYNMGKLKATSSKAIYDKQIALQYLPALKNYPLPLKVALPIFSWIVHSRKGQVVNLISKTAIDTFRKNPNFTPEEKGLTVNKDVLCRGFFFKKGDQLYGEEISGTDLEEMKAMLKDYTAKPIKEFIYYDLDEFNTNKYQNEFIF